MLVVRPEAPADHAAIAEVVAAAFGSPDEAALVAAIRASPEYVPELALVAELDGVVVGHVMISWSTLHHDGGVAPVLSLSPLAVAPDHQRAGVGAALVEAGVAGAEAQGAPLVTVEGDPRYYGRLGFEHSVPHGITIDLPGWAPPEAAQVRLLAGYDPAVRGHVRYAAAFDLVTE